MEIDYYKLCKEQTFTNQTWFCEFIDGSIINCGYGRVIDEFSLESDDKMTEACKGTDEEEYWLPLIEDYYIFDNADLQNVENWEDFEDHPDDDIFKLVPKSYIVKKWFEIKEPIKPIKIKIN